MKKILFTMMLMGTVLIASDALAGGKDGVKKGNRISQKMAVKKSVVATNAKIKSSQLTPVKINSHKAKAVVVEPAKQSKTK